MKWEESGWKLPWEQEVAGSNPAAPTSRHKGFQFIWKLFFCAKKLRGANFGCKFWVQNWFRNDFDPLLNFWTPCLSVMIPTTRRTTCKGNIIPEQFSWWEKFLGRFASWQRCSEYQKKSLPLAEATPGEADGAFAHQLRLNENKLEILRLKARVSELYEESGDKPSLHEMLTIWRLIVEITLIKNR